MPRRIALHRRVEELLDLGKGDDLVELAPDLGARHAEDRAVEIDVLAAGQFGMEAGADLEQAGDAAPDGDAAPRVGSVMRERIFNSVDLPAPLRPMMPSTSPRLTSKLTSLSAQNSSTSSPVHDLAAAQDVGGLAGKGAGVAGDHVAQRGIAAALASLVPDQIALGQVLGLDHDVGHAIPVMPAAGLSRARPPVLQMRSAKLFSMRRNVERPSQRNNAVTATLR